MRRSLIVRLTYAHIQPQTARYGSSSVTSHHRLDHMPACPHVRYRVHWRLGRHRRDIKQADMADEAEADAGHLLLTGAHTSARYVARMIYATHIESTVQDFRVIIARLLPHRLGRSPTAHFDTAQNSPSLGHACCVHASRGQESSPSAAAHQTYVVPSVLISFTPLPLPWLCRSTGGRYPDWSRRDIDICRGR